MSAEKTLAIENTSDFNFIGFLIQQGFSRNLSTYQENQILYSQGDQANSVFYISTGKVKVTVISTGGKEAVVAIRGPDEFCGEGSLTEKPLFLASAIAMTPCEIVELEKEAIADLLRHHFARVGAGAKPGTTRVRYAAGQVSPGGCPFLTTFDLPNADYAAARTSFLQMKDSAWKKVDQIKKDLGERWDEVTGKKK